MKSPHSDKNGLNRNERDMTIDEDVINDIIQYCQKYFEDLEDEIIFGVKEGVSEGLREGVKRGILDGLSKSLDIGFLSISKRTPKKLEEILRDAASGEAKKQVKKAVKSEICPVIQEQLKNLCDSILNKLKEYEIRASGDTVDAIEKIDIGRLAGDRKAEFERHIMQHLEQGHIFVPLFDELQNAVYECITESVNSCEKRIQDAAQGKSATRGRGEV